MANAAGITALRELMRKNVTSIVSAMNNTSLQLTTLITDFKDIKETAENAYRLASKANPSITSQGVRLLGLVNNVSRLNSDIDELKASMATPPELNTLVQSAIEPVKASMDKTLALAIETAETAIKSSFNTLVTGIWSTTDGSIGGGGRHGRNQGCRENPPTPEPRLEELDRTREPTMPEFPKEERIHSHSWHG